jgi:DnaK suppressor protein
MPQKTFTKKFLGTQRDHLMQLSGDISPGVEMERGGDFADQSAKLYEHELALSILSKQSDWNRLVDKALRKIDDGTYGICEICGDPIPKERLEALPFAELDVKCQERVEKYGFARRDTNQGFGFFDAEDENVHNEETESVL